MKANSELEIVFYTKVGDPEGLNKADSVEDHVQLEARLGNGDKIRVRKTTGKHISGVDNISYVFTVKRKSKDSIAKNNALQECTEYSTPVTKEFFDTFKEITEQSLEKRRYFFKNKSITLTLDGTPHPIVLDNVGYEVDFFTTAGKTSEYVKVDVEVDSILEYLEKHFPDLNVINFKIKLGALPFKPTDTIYPPQATQEQKDIVADLWDNKFTERRNDF